MDAFVYSYNEKSLGAKELSKALGIKRILHHNSAFVGSKDKTVINWGAQDVPEQVEKCRVLNHPRVLKGTVNKLSFFQLMAAAEDGPRIPKFTTDVSEAVNWSRKGEMVVGRSKLESKSGAGIHFIADESGWNKNFLDCPLYTQYIKKKDEFRIHIIEGEVVDVQKKVLRKFDQDGQPIDPKTVDFRVRNLENGFIFQKHGIETPKDVFDQAMKSYVTSKLQFGAFDVIFNQTQGKAYVLEVNSAPGLEGSTVTNYAERFKKIL